MSKQNVKPIIMSTEDVRCIVNGMKTMKRIPISPQPEFSQIHLWNGTFVYNSINKKWCWKQHVSPDNCDEVDCLLQFAPFKVGDILYVRETWGDYGGWTSNYVYRADYPLSAKGYWHEEEHVNWCDFPKWRSPVTMPREAARLFLRVTDVRVERVQEITDADAVREGVARGLGFNNVECLAGGCYNGDFDQSCALCDVPVEGFRQLWNARNTKRGYGWDSNPWVWVIEFEECDKH